MTATQAPTPGPLSGDFNVEEYVADYEFRADEGSYSPTENERALLIDAIHGALSEANLSLAPTAPVEASGSVGLAASEIGAHIAKRDAEYEAALADLTIKPDASSLEEFDRSIFGALSDCPAMSIDKQADFVARALWPAVSALSTTPARAEAQDEGAAGEPVAWDSDVLDTFGGYSQNVLTRTPYVAKTGERVRSQTPLYAHPSPTPAADADRVRIAVEALEYYAGPHAMPNDGPWGASSDDYGRRAAEAIAALKSEGK